MTVYDSRFFAGQSSGSRASADCVASIVCDLLSVSSVVDVGCGVGTWLAAFKQQGASRVLGFDGDYVSRSDLQIEQREFEPRDLRQPLRLEGRFDLAISLEVAEHLPASRGPSLVDELVSAAPAVLFSAAIPRQGGTGHINERWQDYWAGLFAERGFRTIDCVRTAVWDDARVEPWYAQNAILYVAPEVELADPGSRLPLSVVHPRVFLKQLDEPLPPRRLARMIGVSVRTMARQTLTR